MFTSLQKQKMNISETPFAITIRNEWLVKSKKKEELFAKADKEKPRNIVKIVLAQNIMNEFKWLKIWFADALMIASKLKSEFETFYSLND